MTRAVFGGGLAALCAAVLLGTSSASACHCNRGFGAYTAGYSPAWSASAYSPSYYTAGYGSMWNSWTSLYAPTYAAYGSYGMYGGSACCPSPCATCCPSPCSPCGAGGCGIGGCGFGGCGIGGCPTGGCGPGGCGLVDAGFGGAATGGCGLTPAQPAVPRTPTPADPVTPRTYREEVGEPIPGGDTVPQSDPGFRRRDPAQEQSEPDMFPTQPYNNEGPEAGRSSAYRPVPRESVIQQRQPAPTEPVDRTGDEMLEDAGPQLGPDLDDRVTWRTAAQRTRLSVQARYTTPQIARHKSAPNRQWTPAGDAPRLVRK